MIPDVLPIVVYYHLLPSRFRRLHKSFLNAQSSHMHSSFPGSLQKIETVICIFYGRPRPYIFSSCRLFFFLSFFFLA